MDVDVAPTDYDNIEILGESGKLVTDLETRVLNRALAKDLRSAILRRDYERSMAEVFDPIPSSLAKTVAVRGFESEYASPIRELGVATVIPRTRTNGAGPKEDRPEFFVVEGMGLLLERLAEDVDVRLNEPVRSVAASPEKVVVATDLGEHHVDGVVVTASLGVLKHGVIAFDPPLPEAHERALANVSMGTMNKVALRFPRAAWPDRDAFVLPEGMVFSFWNLDRYAGEPTLVGLVGGDEAIELEAMDEGERIGRCFKELSVSIPGLPEPTEGLVTNWSADPWSFGSYSRLGPGGRGNEPKTLAKPINERIYLAGEATHPNDPATVHGAFQSGERAASALMRTL